MIGSEDEEHNTLQRDANSVQSESLGTNNKRTRRKRKRPAAKKKTSQDALSLNLEGSRKSDSQTNSSNDSLQYFNPLPEDDYQLVLRLKNFAARNRIYPLFISTQIKMARFFVIKANHEDDVHKSIKYGIWCSSLHGNSKLQQAFLQSQYQVPNKADALPIFLFFSMANGGYFMGVARMASSVQPDLFFTRWLNWQLWCGLFKVEWLMVKDISNKALNHIPNR